ncbi:MAG: hypothetical protein WD356_08580, partial [Pseudomonadales bacterium]
RRRTVALDYRPPLKPRQGSGTGPPSSFRQVSTEDEWRNFSYQEAGYPRSTRQEAHGITARKSVIRDRQLARHLLCQRQTISLQTQTQGLALDLIGG